jgi:hypothetical protein
VLLATALALLTAAPAPAVRVDSAGGGLVARLHVHDHTPKAGETWPIHITAHDTHGHRVHASVRYAYIYGGEVVKRIDPHGPNDFVGDWRDHHFEWSKTTIGLELTFRAVVDSHLGQANLDYAVKVHR